MAVLCPQSQAVRAGHESPGGDCGWPHWSQSKEEHLMRGEITADDADKAGHESPGEDCGWPYQTVAVN